MDMDFYEPDFRAAVEYVTGDNQNAGGIGTLSEKRLHAALKHYFEPRIENHEIPIGSYVADIVGEYGIIEIQTSNFQNLNAKLGEFLQAAPVTVVYPIAAKTRYVWVDKKTGEQRDGSRNGNKGSLLDLFSELYKISDYVFNPNFSLCVILLDVIEYRFEGKYAKCRRRGSERIERYPEHINSIVRFQNAYDYLSLLPEKLPEQFTVKQLGELIKNKRKAGIVAYSMNKVGLIRRVDADSRAYVYERAF